MRSNLILVPIEDILQRITDFTDDSIAQALELGQLVRLLQQSIECADLEFWDVEVQHVAVGGVDGFLER